MANKYTWNIISLDIVPSLDGETNVVSNIHWTFNGTDGVNTTSMYGVQSLKYDPKSPFTAYKDLKRAQVQGWLEEALGQSQVAELEANLDKQLELLANPIPVAGSQIALPWNIPETPVPA